MIKPITISALQSIVCWLCFSPTLWAQTTTHELEKEILQRDSSFWQAYNSCDSSGYRQFFTQNIEFYHDKGGLTTGIDAIISSFQDNLCEGNFRLKRKAVEGSIQFYPLENSTGFYGAIISGEHLFYVLEPGKTERLDGLAKFTNLWIRENNTWKMSRIISYDHGPAPYLSSRREIKLPLSTLDYFTGKYQGPHSGTVIIERENDLLVFNNNNRRFFIYPEAANVFFSKDRNLSFEFLRNERNELSKLVIREKGEIAELLTYIR
jgi:hypothetical protein